MNMEVICDKIHCTGCGLCAALCPKHCITMQAGNLGHLYPEIDQSVCVDCRLCKKNCPQLGDMEFRYPQKAYAAWAKDDDDYKSSTSGGAASVFTHYILKNGGVVYGCVCRPGIRIEHVRVERMEDADKLKGSKYVQSNIVGVLPEIRNDVNSGRRVLFIGTPCQVAAVKRMFKEQPNNLLLVDIVCHGVPSNKWLADYITDYLRIIGDGVTSVMFRFPDSFSLCVYSQGRMAYKSNNLWINRYRDLYCDTFIDGFTYRDSCYCCRYARLERISDITIGDFWGLGKEKDDSYMPAHPYGISCVLQVTGNGKDLIQAVKDELNIYERPITEAINGNDQLRKPKKKTLRIKIFRQIHDYLGIGTAYRLCCIDKIFCHLVKNVITKK